MSSDPTDHEKFVFMKHSSVPGSSLWDRTVYGRLCPMRGLEVKYDKVGEVASVLILTAENKQFVTLVKSCGMA